VGAQKCAKEKSTSRGGDFCGYNDRTSGRWGTALLPAEDGFGNIHELKMAKGSEHMVSL
jgi:hypothetical protein